MSSFAIAIRRAYFEAQKHRKCAKNVVVNRSASGFPTKRDSNQYPLLQGLARRLKFRPEQVYRYTFQLVNDNDADQFARIRFSQTPKTGFLAPRPISCLLYSLKQCYVTSHFGSSRRFMPSVNTQVILCYPYTALKIASIQTLITRPFSHNTDRVEN